MRVQERASKSASFVRLCWLSDAFSGFFGKLSDRFIRSGHFSEKSIKKKN